MHRLLRAQSYSLLRSFFHSDAPRVIRVSTRDRVVSTSSIAFGPKTCTFCGKTIDFQDPVCPKCHSIQKFHARNNYFSLFGFDTTFDIDLKLLKERFLALQASVHPDKHSDKEPGAVRMLEDYSTMVNKAYETLKNPHSRGRYVMKIRGVLFEDDSLDNEFLMGIMELNEAIQKASESDKDLLKLEKRCQEYYNGTLLAVQTGFAEHNYKSAYTGLGKLKYYEKCLNSIKEIKFTKGIVE